MSTGSKQQTESRTAIPPNLRNRAEHADLNGFSRVLWEIGESRITDTRRQLRMAARICDEREMFNGGGRQ